ncbi:unnamed protein product [Knipowitschia caucasica]|uniref:Uncharacterized protein n=1 Tax=Knipowitschia caucasica TaxID=637954 RepID=A0AAV2IPZ2_KNICA
MDLRDLLEDWPWSLQILGSVWFESLGVCTTRISDGRGSPRWALCLHVLQTLRVEVPAERLLEQQDVCVNVLGPLTSDDSYVWLFLQH